MKENERTSQMINENTVCYGSDGRGSGGERQAFVLPHPPEHCAHQLITRACSLCDLVNG